MYLRHILGRKGEDVVVDYLKNINYNILDRNFSCKQGEIDVIALDGNYVVFVEIKSRTSTEYGLPSEAVTKTKINHMMKTAEYYLYIKHLENENVRFDVVEVYVKDEKYYINHINCLLYTSSEPTRPVH